MPPPPPPPPPAANARLGGTRGVGGAVWGWAKEHKWLVAGMAAIVVGGGVMMAKRRRQRGKRRKALKAANGARKEVVGEHNMPLSVIRRCIAIRLASVKHEGEG